MAIVTAAQICNAAFTHAFRPEPDITVSEWADRYRIVGKPSPEPGPWRTERVPYMRQIMDDLSPGNRVEIVVLEKAAQGAGTEGGLNAVGCWMHKYPDPIMLVLPTTGVAKKFSRTRIEKLIDANPDLKAIVSPARSRDSGNTILLKEFGATRDTLMIIGANSGADLRSNPARYMIMDEVDGYPFDVDDEGDPVDLAIQRTATYRNRKIFMLSTPTIEEVSHIHRWFLRGDQRLFHVPCPFCGHMQPWVWYPGEEKLGGLRWPKGQPELARYQCERCGDQFEEWRKNELLPRGEWVASSPSAGGGKIHSYRINALYYPYGWPENAWPNLARLWEETHKDPTRLKSFVNLKLGEPWKDPAEAKAESDDLLSRRESYGATLPDSVAVLTAGVDVQANRIEAELVGWGRDEESWSIEYRVFLGDTTQPVVWAELDTWLRGQWLSELSVSLAVRAACVDTNYRPEISRKFCHERTGRKIFPIIGKPGQSVPVWPAKASQQRGKYPPPYAVGIDAAKEVIYARLRLQSLGPGFCHFPSNYDRHYFDMLTSEARIPDYSGPVPRYVWRKKQAGARNEALDCRVYAYAALQALGITTALRLNVEAENLRRVADAARRGDPVVDAAPKPRRSSWMNN